MGLKSTFDLIDYKKSCALVIFCIPFHLPTVVV